MVDIGSVIALKYFIFKKGENKIDHARKRPCVIIATDDEYYYLLAMSSYSYDKEKQRYLKVPIDVSLKKCYIDLESIYKTKIAGYFEYSFYEEEDLLNLLLKFYHYQEKRSNDDFNKIKENIKLNIKKLSTNTNRR